MKASKAAEMLMAENTILKGKMEKRKAANNVAERAEGVIRGQGIPWATYLISNGMKPILRR